MTTYTRFAAIVLLGIATAIHAAAQDCGRACLEGFVDQYLDALVAHDMSQLPTTPDLKMTEDGARLLPGDGFARSAVAKGTYRLFAADTETGQVAFMGTMREAPNNPVIIATRLKVTGEQVSEIETMVVRNAEGAANLEQLGSPNPVFLDATPEAQRASRADLIRIANMYFSGLQLNDGRGEYPFADTCDRLENGFQATNNPTFNADLLLPASGLGRGKGKGKGKGKAAPPPPPPFNPGALGCKAQFESGYFHFVTRIRDRRFVAVDAERGLVFSFVFFDHAAGDARNVTLTDGTQITAGPERPLTLEIAEMFKIEDGLIQHVEAVLQQVPYGMGSGWSSHAQAMSSEPQDIR